MGPGQALPTFTPSPSQRGCRASSRDEGEEGLIQHLCAVGMSSLQPTGHCCGRRVPGRAQSALKSLFFH